ncbi:MAG: aromatic ring-hydroxylating dioxygenase subunit alpha, partial [Pseudomonadota bacterium]
DRTREHLGKTDVGIIRYRRMLRAAIKALESDTDALPMHNGVCPTKITGPISTDTITKSSDWRAAFVDSDNKRREQCSQWDASVNT